MERILLRYAAAYDPLYPVVCFDERPCFLIGDIVEGLQPANGSKKEHYAYEKNGSCSVLAAIEPQTGRRIAHVRRYRRGLEFTKFMQHVAQTYPEAKKIRVVLDNLNTHHAGSFYKHLPAAEAQALADRLEFIHTPKSASWLNMIEIEFSALSRLCLNRRIPRINDLSAEVFAFFEERNNKGIKINWQFTVDTARQKLNRHYKKVNPVNEKYKET